jgi:hypothetical protein
LALAALVSILLLARSFRVDRKTSLAASQGKEKTEPDERTAFANSNSHPGSGPSSIGSFHDFLLVFILVFTRQPAKGLRLAA